MSSRHRHPHAVPVDHAVRRQPTRSPRSSSGSRRTGTGSPSSRRATTAPAVDEAGRRVRAVLNGERETVFLPDEPYPRYFFAGATYAVRHNSAIKLIAAPADLIANIDVLLEAEQFDLLHLHEPFVPGLGWTALRHAGCPLVATFYANPERLRAVLGQPAAAAAPVRLAGRRHRLVARRRATPRPSRSPARTASSPRASTWSCSARPRRDARRPRCACSSPAPIAAQGPRRAAAQPAASGGTARAELHVDVCGAATQERRYARLVPPAFAGPRDLPRPRVRRGGRPGCFRAPTCTARRRSAQRRAGLGLIEAMASGHARHRLAICPATTRWCRDQVDGLLVPRRDSARPRRGRPRLCSTTPSCARRPRLATPCTGRGATTGSASPARSRPCTKRWPGGGARCRAAAASSASCSPTSTSTRTTARTA